MFWANLIDQFFLSGLAPGRVLRRKKQESPTSSQWNKQICFWCYENRVGMVNITNIKYLAILCDLFGMVKWALQRLSDLQLGDKKVTLKHMVNISWSLTRPYHGFLNAIKRCRHHKLFCMTDVLTWFFLRSGVLVLVPLYLWCCPHLVTVANKNVQGFPNQNIKYVMSSWWWLLLGEG